MEHLPTPVERIHLELTNHCNFSCEFCPDRIMTRPRGVMKEDLAKKALEEIAAQRLSKQVDLHIMGEPTLHPKLSEIISYGTGLGLRLSLTTNGSLLTSELVDRLINAHLNELIISVQTPDGDSFKKRYSKGITFEDYCIRIKEATHQIVKSNSSLQTIITFRTTPFKRFLLPSTRISLIDDNKTLRKILGHWLNFIAKDLMAPKEFEKALKSINKLSVLKWNRFHLLPNLIFESRLLGDWAHSKIDKSDACRAKFGFCHGLTENFGILWNGDFVFCCADFNGRTSIGQNIEDTKIVKWMANPEVKKVASDFSRFRVTHPYCQICLGGPTWTYALAKTIGSIFYFKIYRRFKKEVTN